MSDPAAAAHSFTKIFAQARAHAKFRTQTDVNEGIKKIRRLILVEGIPASLVRMR
jgi:cell cycle arrest protein BUB2